MDPLHLLKDADLFIGGGGTINSEACFLGTPKLPQNFSLNNSIEHFRDSIKYNKMPITSKKSILNVIKALEIISKV
jgi:predicted glycosyltransferase